MTARKKTPDDEEPRRMVDEPLTFVASEAATAAVRLGMEGSKPEPQGIWTAIRRVNDQTKTPPYFSEVLNSPTFRTLFEIRMRRATLHSLEDVAFLKQTVRDTLNLAADAVLEDMIVRPESVKTTEKMKLVMDFSQLKDRLDAKDKPPVGELGPVPSAIEVAAEQVDAMEDTIRRLPPTLRDRAIRRWKLDKLKELESKESELRDNGEDDDEDADQAQL